MADDSPPARLPLYAAFAVVYLAWGSTYLGIRIGVQDLPPALLAGLRFTAAGLIMTAVALAMGQRLPRSRHDWRLIGIMGLSMVVLGNGLVTWAEQWVPSNQAALIIASSALWMAWFGTFGPRGQTLSGGTKLGLGLGFAGVSLLFWTGGSDGMTIEFVWAKLALIGATLSWTAGTIYARNQPPATPPMMFAAQQMLAGGLALLVLGLLAGEPARAAWTPAGLGALAYLTLIGSCLAYATYFWLIHHATPARLGTIAYVNPAVATVLGWWWLGEVLTGLQIAGMGVILLGVVLVTVCR